MNSKIFWMMLAAAGLAGGLSAQQVNTVVTNGLIGPTAVAVASDGAYYIADSDMNRIVKFVPSTVSMTVFAGSPLGTSGSQDQANGLQATFYSPQAIVAARGGFVVADSANNTLRFISPAGAVSKLAGTGSVGPAATGPVAALAATFNYPVGLAVDESSGNIFIADAKNGAIRVLLPSNQVITLTNGFEHPAALAVGENGNLWVADKLNNTICVVSNGVYLTNISVTIVAGQAGVSGADDWPIGTSATFSLPRGLLWLGGGAGLLVSDTGNSTLRQVIFSQAYGAYSVTTLAGYPGQQGAVDGALATARFNFPAGLSLDTAVGGILVADRGNRMVRRLQLTAPQPPVGDPTIGFIIPKETYGYTVSPFSSVTLNNEPSDNDGSAIGIMSAERGVQTTYLVMPYPTNILATVPDPTETDSSTGNFIDGDAYTAAQSSEPQLRDGSGNADLLLRTRSSSSGRTASKVVQSRVVFQVASPAIQGDDAAAFVVSNFTRLCRMYYTTNGQDPVDQVNTALNTLVPSDGRIALDMGDTNVIFKVRGFKSGYKPSPTVTKTFYTNAFSGNLLTLGFETGEGSSAYLASAGQMFYAPVTLTAVPGQAIYSMGFDLAVTNAVGSANFDAAGGANLKFQSMLQQKMPGEVYVPIPPQFAGQMLSNLVITPYLVTNLGVVSTNYLTNIVGPAFPHVPVNWASGYLTNMTNTIRVNTNLLGIAWLETPGETNLYDSKAQDLITYSMAHVLIHKKADQKIIVGSFGARIPPTAALSNAYYFQVLNGSGAVDMNSGVTLYTPSRTNVTAVGPGTLNGLKRIVVTNIAYLVGDVSNFRWLNAGDFGDGYLDIDDVSQTFQSAVYGWNVPPTNSDYFNSMDSSDGGMFTDITRASYYWTPRMYNPADIDSITNYDHQLNVDDVYVTLRRSLDPYCKWYTRCWTNGALGSFQVSNALAKPFIPASLRTPAAAASLDSTNLPFVEVFASNAVATGSSVSIPIQLNVHGDLPVRHLMMRIRLVPLGSTPKVPVAPAFLESEISALGVARTKGAGFQDSFAALYVSPQVGSQPAGLSGGSHLLGNLVVTLPDSLPASAAYWVKFEHFSASPNGVGLFPKIVHSGFINPQNAQVVMQKLSARMLKSGGAKNLSLSWQGAQGLPCVLEVSDRISGGSWTSVYTDDAATGASQEVLETGASAQTRFYRVRLLDQ